MGHSHASHIYAHICIGSLVVWPDWMPLRECDHHWTCLSEREGLWASIECDWMRLSVCERLWVSIEQNWTRLNAIECAWTQLCKLNATEYTLILIPTWNLVRMNAFEWVWIWLNTNECNRVHVNAFERVLNPIECTECTWTPLSKYWTRLNTLECMWMPLSKYWIQLNAIEHAWGHVNTSEWVLNLCECTRLLEVI